MKSIEQSLIAPESMVIVGASENPEKIGGRPLRLMNQLGYQGRLYAVNPNRSSVQSVASFRSVSALPEPPELAYIAVAGADAVVAVKECADKGVRVAVVISSGFGEVNVEGRAIQDEMVSYATARGMRIVGPNSQGLANFGTGAISSFSTMFVEIPPQDGPVAIVSQSGAMCQMAYGQLREKGVGVRHVHATGNESDVTVSDLACAVVQDPAIKVLLLYFEAIQDPWRLAEAARAARDRGIAIVAIKSGRTEQGQLAASSHTGAMANEDKVVDAFFRKHGIWRAEDVHDQLRCVELYLKGWKPKGNRLVVVSNSGASCVMAADIAAGLNLQISPLAVKTKEALAKTLPGFASVTNPIDITAALLTNSHLFGRVLPLLHHDPQTDMVFIQIPVSGAAYDVAAFARDTANFVRDSGVPVAICIWQQNSAKYFIEAGLPVFSTTRDALQALSQLVEHHALIEEASLDVMCLPAEPATKSRSTAIKQPHFLSEAESLLRLQDADIPVVGFTVCGDSKQAREAFADHGPIVVVKACSPEIPHKSEHNLVALRLKDADAVAQECIRQFSTLDALKVQDKAVIVASMVAGHREFMVGARRDPGFGPVVVIGDGGKYVEALRDFVLLIPPFSLESALRAMESLRIAPLYEGVRGDPPLDVRSVAEIAVKVGKLILSDPIIQSLDINPIVTHARGQGAVVVDALVEVA